MYKRKFAGVMVLGFLACSGARADDPGFYLGASIGEATQSSGVFDGADTSYRLLAGYSFSKYFAVEAGFVDGGTQEDTIEGLDVSSSNDGAFAALLAKLPISERFSPYAKIGWVTYDSRTTVSNGVAKFSESTSDGDLSFGGGLEMQFGPHFRLRADYEKVKVPDVAFDMYSLIASWKF